MTLPLNLIENLEGRLSKFIEWGVIAAIDRAMAEGGFPLNRSKMSQPLGSESDGGRIERQFGELCCNRRQRVGAGEWSSPLRSTVARFTGVPILGQLSSAFETFSIGSALNHNVAKDGLIFISRGELRPSVVGLTGKQIWAQGLLNRRREIRYPLYRRIQNGLCDIRRRHAGDRLSPSRGAR